MTEHTPGPWKAIPNMLNTAVFAIVDANGNVVVAECGQDKKVADLIAAAPELLAALKPLAFCDDRQPPYGVEVDDWTAAVHAARAAIAKIKGAAQ